MYRPNRIPSVGKTHVCGRCGIARSTLIVKRIEVNFAGSTYCVSTYTYIGVTVRIYTASSVNVPTRGLRGELPKLNVRFATLSRNPAATAIAMLLLVQRNVVGGNYHVGTSTMPAPGYPWQW